MSEVLELSVPAMYADHHVQRVRATLLALTGVEDVCASAADMRVTITYHPEDIDAAAIRAALERAGYREGQEPALVTQSAGQATAWHQSSVRPTESNAADKRASGDFRRY